LRGAFYFRVHRKSGAYKLLDADDMEAALREAIGRKSTPYGPARVLVRNLAGQEVASARVFPLLGSRSGAGQGDKSSDEEHRQREVPAFYGSPGRKAMRTTYPCIGNHDSGELASPDDRDQVMDNLYLRERFAGEEKYGRASIDPGLFYRFRYGPEHHLHAPSAGLFEKAVVRAMFSGHEHNFQHSRQNSIDYFITGGAGKIRRNKPSTDGFEDAHTTVIGPVEIPALLAIVTVPPAPSETARVPLAERTR
jgi:hypothetical protein